MLLPHPVLSVSIRMAKSMIFVVVPDVQPGAVISLVGGGVDLNGLRYRKECGGLGHAPQLELIYCWV
jgi:hypothetical protein